MTRSIRNQPSFCSLLQRGVPLVAGTLSLLGLLSSPAHAQFGVSKDRRFDQNTYLSTHNAMANPEEGFLLPFSNQPSSVVSQLEDGVRSINLDIWLVQQQYAHGGWQMRIYNGDVYRDTFPGLDFRNTPYEIVVAHDPFVSGRFMLTPNSKFKSLRDVLAGIRAWMDHTGNTREVVSIDFENQVPSDASWMIQRAFVDSDMLSRTFYMSGPNVGMPPPPARVGKEQWWNVAIHGFPTLNQMADAKKRLVIYPDDGFIAYSTYGDASLSPSTWSNARDVSLNDFRYPIFNMTHSPDIGASILVSGKNDISVLHQHWNDMRRRWNRIPTEVGVDFYRTGAGSPSGPRQLVTELNYLWAGLPPITATATPRSNPSGYGWYRNNIYIDFGSIGDVFRTAVMHNFGAQQDVQAGTIGVVNVEGVTTVSYDVIGALGNRSERKYMEVRLDKTPPYLKGVRETFPNLSDWYNHDVTVNYTATDPLSGIDSYTPSVVVTREGAKLWATGTATDRAGNTAVTNDVNINIDKTPPTTDVQVSPAAINLWRRGPVTVRMTTEDPAKPGVNRVSGSYIIQYVMGDYRSPDTVIATYWNQYVGEPFTPGTGPFTIQTDGRHLLSYRSVDKALNFQWKTVTINIDGTAPHTTERLAPQVNSAGWQRGPVTVSLASTDAMSGIDRVSYSVDGGAFQTYIRPFVVTGDGIHAVRVQSYDRAGNREDRTFAVRIGTPNLRISRVTNVRRTGGKIIADVGLYNYGTADVANPVLVRSTLARQFAIGPLPTTGMIPIGSERMFTLAYPDAGSPRGTVVPLLMQGTFEGGVFSSSVSYSLP